MSNSMITKITGGYTVAGLELLAGNCAFGRLNGSYGFCPGPCCFTFSQVKQAGQSVLYLGKKALVSAGANYEWGYRVIKDGTEVEVKMLAARTPVPLPFGGHEPPPLSAWEERGWKVLYQFERPIIGMGTLLPEWCTSAEPEDIPAAPAPASSQPDNNDGAHNYPIKK